MATKSVKVLGHRIRETDKAILWDCSEFEHDDSTPDSPKALEEWFPLSQVESIHPDYIVVSAWIAEKKGLV
jgi:hypothetical protein